MSPSIHRSKHGRVNTDRVTVTTLAVRACGRRRGLLAGPLLALLAFASSASAQVRWERWRHRWDDVELQGYFPELRIKNAAQFRPHSGRGLISGPYEEAVLDWPVTLRIQVQDETPRYRVAPRLPVLTAGLMHQAILVEVAGADPPDAAYPIQQQHDLRDTRVLRLTWRPGLALLYLLRVSDLPLGENRFQVVVEDPDGDELGRLPLAITTREAGRLKVRVLAAGTREPTPARVGVYAGEEDEHFEYSRDAVTLHKLRDTDQMQLARDVVWPSANRRIFYTRGEFTMSLRPGVHRLLVKKGIEYGLEDLSFSVAAGETVEREVVLTRQLDLPAEGWYSGDDQIHVARDGNNNEELLDWTRGEDIHAATICQMGDIRRLYYLQYGWQEGGTFQLADSFLVPGQEDPRTVRRGHSLMIYNRVTHWNPRRYFLYGEVMDATHADGGVAGYAHWGTGFHADRGLAIDVPLGRCDFVEVLQNNVLKTGMLYHYWNLGFALTPLGGTDYPYGRGRSLGNSSFFTYVPGEFTPQAWVAAIRRGHTYVSNGPALDFRVADLMPGDRLDLDGPGCLPVVVRARLNPTLDRLQEVNLISMGEILRQRLPASGEEHDLSFEIELPVEQSQWLALQVKGHKTIAHTNAIYLTVAGRPFFKREGLEQRLAASEEKLRDLESELESGKIPSDQAPELQATIDRARAVYQQIQQSVR